MEFSEVQQDQYVGVAIFQLLSEMIVRSEVLIVFLVDKPCNLVILTPSMVSLKPSPSFALFVMIV